eukprot:501424-Pelagomonas_calceolata.AAC.1
MPQVSLTHPHPHTCVPPVSLTHPPTPTTHLYATSVSAALPVDGPQTERHHKGGAEVEANQQRVAHAVGTEAAGQG